MPDYVLSGSADRTVRKWELRSYSCVLTFEGHTSLVYKLLAAGDLLFTSSYDRTARCWDLELGDEVHVYEGHTRGLYPLLYMAVSLDATDGFGVLEADVLLPGEREAHLLVTGSADGTAKLWSVDRAHCMRTFDARRGGGAAGGPVTSLASDSTGGTIFTGSTDGIVRSFKTSTGDPLRAYAGHTAAITALQVEHFFSAHLVLSKVLYSHMVWWFTRLCSLRSVQMINKYLYSSSADKTVRAHIVESGIEYRLYRGHKLSVNAFRSNQSFSARFSTVPYNVQCNCTLQD